MENHKILVIDDLASVHEDFKNILTPNKNLSTDQVEKLGNLLFNDSKESEAQLPPFSIDSCYQGDEGIERVRQSLLVEEPYALAFVDV